MARKETHYPIPIMIKVSEDTNARIAAVADTYSRSKASIIREVIRCTLPLMESYAKDRQA